MRFKGPKVKRDICSGQKPMMYWNAKKCNFWIWIVQNALIWIDIFAVFNRRQDKIYWAVKFTIETDSYEKIGQLASRQNQHCRLRPSARAQLLQADYPFEITAAWKGKNIRKRLILHTNAQNAYQLSDLFPAWRDSVYVWIGEKINRWIQTNGNIKLTKMDECAFQEDISPAQDLNRFSIGRLYRARPETCAVLVNRSINRWGGSQSVG